MCVFSVPHQVEAQHPGFAYDLIKSILQRAELQGSVDMTESLLRLENINTSDGKSHDKESVLIREHQHLIW